MTCAADPVQLDFVDSGDGLGCDVRVRVRPFGEPFKPMNPTPFQDAYAGASSVLFNGASARSFSLEFGQPAGGGSDFFSTTLELAGHPGSINALKADAIAALFNANNQGVLSTAMENAVFQSMIWEIIYDFDDSEDSIAFDGSGRGRFNIRGLDQALFDKMKADVLARLDTTRRFQVVSSPTMQDQVLSVIPLPGPALMGSALLALAAARRRR